MSIEIPGYKIRQTLGKGGMATVYLAQQEIFERDVALKVMSRALADDPSFGQRFFREAKIVSQLVHPNIVTVYDVGAHDNTYYLSMEYIDGGDLKCLRKNFSLAQKIRAVRDIAKALDYAGSKGYVHRDIKPENIMFHTVDNRAVLMDFGIARAAETDASMTQTGTAIGTPHYMSPEQAKGQPVDSRSDLYSLGVVFYLLIAGSVPYDAESAVAIGIKHITEPLPRLPKGYESLQPLIDKLMAKQPDDRFQTAREFTSALTRISIPRIEKSLSELSDTDRQQALATDIKAATALTPAVSGVRPSPKKAVARFPQPSEEDELGLKPALVSFEDDEFDIKPSGGWAAWVAGAMVLVLVAVFVLYHQRPELVLPWLAKTHQVFKSAEAATTDFSREAKTWLESFAKPQDEQTGAATEAQAPEDAPVETLAPEPVVAAVQPSPQPTPVVTSAAEPELSQPAPEPEGESPAIQALRVELEKLSSRFHGERDKLPDLVDAHRALLANVPNDTLALASLDELRQSEMTRIKEQSVSGDIEDANKRLLQLRYLFPDISAKEYRKLEKWVAKQEQVRRWLAEADDLLARNQLTIPADNCALDRYKQVLKLDPDNALGKAGLEKVAAKLGAMAETSLASGDDQKARSQAEKAQELNPVEPSAQRVLAKLQARENVQKQRKEQLALGKRRLDSGDLFEPETNSAYYYYSQVLKRHPNDGDALSGIDRVLEALSGRIWRLVGEERFAQAKAELDRPRRLMGDIPELRSLALAVDEIVVEKQLAQMSRISHLLVSNNELVDLTGVQEVLTLGNPLFLGIRFENFPAQPTELTFELRQSNRLLMATRFTLPGEKGATTLALAPLPGGLTPGKYDVFVTQAGRIVTSASITMQ